MKEETAIVPVENVTRRIMVLRGHRVLLDSDLAELYGVETGHLNRAVKRNAGRFPSDFMFQLTAKEAEFLKSQFGISNPGRGGRRYLPFAFTEQGVAMLSSVLNSERAVRVNITIMRAFVKLREMLETNRELAKKFSELESRVGKHDEQIAGIIEAIRELIAPTEDRPRREIGFHVRETESKESKPAATNKKAKLWCSPKIRPVVKLAKDHWNEKRNDEQANTKEAQCGVQGAGRLGRVARG